MPIGNRDKPYPGSIPDENMLSGCSAFISGCLAAIYIFYKKGKFCVHLSLHSVMLDLCISQGLAGVLAARLCRLEDEKRKTEDRL